MIGGGRSIAQFKISAFPPPHSVQTFTITPKEILLDEWAVNIIDVVLG